MKRLALRLHRAGNRSLAAALKRRLKTPVGEFLPDPGGIYVRELTREEYEAELAKPLGQTTNEVSYAGYSTVKAPKRKGW